MKSSLQETNNHGDDIVGRETPGVSSGRGSMTNGEGSRSDKERRSLTKSLYHGTRMASTNFGSEVRITAVGELHSTFEGA